MKIRIENCLKIYLLFSVVAVFTHFYISFLINDWCVWNEGIALGLFSGVPALYLVLGKVMLLCVTVAVFGGNICFLKKHWEVLFVLFLASGSNIIDRLAHGAVCDYISISNLPVFNLNDIFILISLGIILSVIFYEEICCRRKKCRE